MFDWLRRGLARRRDAAPAVSRRAQLGDEELGEEPPERFVLVVQLMIVFFVGLLALEVAHMVVLGGWNDVIFNGIMLVVGTIVGAVWGRQSS